jgi:hypothetical protein
MSNKDYNKRMKTKELSKKKKAERFVIKDITVEEILDESGEVNELTIVKISFEGILIHLSVGAAMRLVRKLQEVLDN